MTPGEGSYSVLNSEVFDWEQCGNHWISDQDVVGGRIGEGGGCARVLPGEVDPHLFSVPKQRSGISDVPNLSVPCIEAKTCTVDTAGVIILKTTFER